MNNNNYYSSKYNHIYLYDDITNSSVLKIIKKIEKYNNIDKKNIYNIKNNDNNNGFYVKSKPIVIHINSQGGDAYAGIALTNIIHKSIVPIITIIEGICMSAATFVAIMSQHRVIAPNSFMLIHQYSQCVKKHSKHDEFEFQQVTGKKLMNDLYKIYTNHSNLPKNEIKKIMKQDLYLTSQQCLKYKIVDEILQPHKNSRVSPLNNKNKTDINSIYIYNESNNSKKGNSNNEDSCKKNSLLKLVKKLHKSMRMSSIPTPLHVFISETSYFDKLMDVLPIINAFENINIPINVTIEGPIGQYSLLYAIIGDKRKIYKYAYVIIDFIDDNVKSQKLDDVIENNITTQKLIITILKKYTKIPKNILDTFFTKRYLFNATECVKYGIVDEII
jgi:ATP-dependent Clp protease protease subunit